MWTKIITDSRTSLYLHYLSCGNLYDSELYGCSQLQSVKKIDPGIIVKVSGWETDQPLFTIDAITEFSLYSYNTELLPRVLEKITAWHKTFRDFHFSTLPSSADEPRAMLSRDPVDVAIETPKWLQDAEIQHVVHHNQTLDVLDDYLNRPEHYGEQPVLVHVDTHSDIYQNPSVSPGGIGNYINELLVKRKPSGEFMLNEHFYWIVPENQPFQPASVTSEYYDTEEGTPYQKEYYLDESGILFAKPGQNRRKITFHVCTMTELPGINDNEVILDIDLDYFSCKFRFNPTHAQLTQRLSVFNQQLNEKLRPRLAIICQSPDFTPVEDCEYLVNYFQSVTTKKNIRAEASSFKHAGVVEADLYYLDFLNEHPELLEEQRSRQLILHILQQRQLYTAAALCTHPGKDFHLGLNSIISHMITTQTGINAHRDDLMSDLRNKYSSY